MKDYADGLTCIIPGFPQKMWDRIYYPFFIDETLAQRCHVISKIDPVPILNLATTSYTTGKSLNYYVFRKKKK